MEPMAIPERIPSTAESHGETQPSLKLSYSSALTSARLKTISAPIRAIVFLEQAPENSIEEVDSFTKLSLLMQQTVMPTKREDMSQLLDMLGHLIENTRMFKLKCNISEEAVLTAYNAIYRDNYDE